MVGITEVAELAGVSTATVSRALSGSTNVLQSTRERVLAAALKLGYVVSSSASSLASGRTRNVGVVVPSINRWFYGAVLEGADQALLNHGYDLTLYNIGGGHEERKRVFEDFILRQRVDAVIAISLELTSYEVDRLLAINKPTVGIGGPLSGVHTLSLDDAAVARLATEHLIHLGHTAIAHIGGNPSHELDFPLPTNRRKGYEDALRDAGIPVDPALFYPTDFSLEGGYVAAKQLLGTPHKRPTAIFTAADEVAFGAIMAAKDLGLRVPDDLSVIGIDGHDLCNFYGLTTVSQFPAQQGRMAVDIIMSKLDPDYQDSGISNTPLPFELIVRSSTSRPPQR